FLKVYMQNLWNQGCPPRIVSGRCCKSSELFSSRLCVFAVCLWTATIYLYHPMNTEIITQTARQTLAGTISFPEVVGQLLTAGVEYYHVDYVSMRKTFY